MSNQAATIMRERKTTRQRRWKDVRGAWFSTPSRVKRPLDAAYAASIRTVALGRHEFGHMYRRMKSSALFRAGGQRCRPTVCATTARRRVSTPMGGER